MRLVLFLLALRSIASAGIADASCEPVGANHFRLTFAEDHRNKTVRIFASHSAEQGKPAKAIAKTRQTPVEIDLVGFEGRPYFHLRDGASRERVVSIRRLPLEGQENFRDLGGYRTTDGRHVRWGKLYRSGQLSTLSEKDYAYIKPLGIRLVCDFRTGSERARQPTRWSGGPELFANPIGDDDKGWALNTTEFERVFEAGGGASEVREVMTAIYRNLSVHGTPRYSQMLARLLAGDTPSMVHCTSGKDRTGTFSAILLTILGVPSETVMQDYLLTNEYVLAPDRVSRTVATIQKQYRLAAMPSVETVKPMLGVEAVFLETFWKGVTEQYGSFDDYRRAGLKISDAEASRLREMYLEP